MEPSSKRAKVSAPATPAIAASAIPVPEALLAALSTYPTLHALHTAFTTVPLPPNLLSLATAAREATFPHLQAPVTAQQYNPIYACASICVAFATLNISMAREDKAKALRAVDLAVLRAGAGWGAVAEPLVRLASIANDTPVPSQLPPIPSHPLPPSYLTNTPHATPIPRIDARSLTPASFRDLYMTSSPVILAHAIAHWPALRKWRDLDYLKAAAGDRLVPVETYDKKDAAQTYLTESWQQEVMPLGEYIADFFKRGEQGESDRRGYLAQHQLFDQIPTLRDDIATPAFCVPTAEDTNAPSACENAATPIVSAWLGPGGTVSPLHNDPYHNLLAQVVGRKYVRVYEVGETARLYPREGPLCNNSLVNLDDGDWEKFPRAKEAPFSQCVLEAGEVLYIPKLAWHYVRGLEPSFSVSFWWGAKMALAKKAGEDNYSAVY